MLHKSTITIYYASANPHTRAASSISPALASPSPRVLASHTARAALHSVLLRNCTTVLNRGTRANAHMNARIVSRDSVGSRCSGGAAAASTGISEARRVGSSEAPKRAGREVGWTVCQSDNAKSQHIETEVGERVMGLGWWWVRTFNKAQRAVVSAAGMRSHARVNSKSVSGTAAAARVGVSAGAGTGVGASGTTGAGTSRVSTTVSLPDMRKMPPPTRPTDFASRVCFASLNDDADVGFWVMGAVAGASSVGVDVGGDNTRELMGFRKSLLVGRGALVDVEGVGCDCDCGVSSSTMVIGMRRRFWGAVVEEEEEGEDADARGIETSTGPDRCATMTLVREVERGGTSEPKRSREKSVPSCSPSSRSG
jgi:hypothetical protein